MTDRWTKILPIGAIMIFLHFCDLSEPFEKSTAIIGGENGSKEDNINNEPTQPKQVCKVRTITSKFRVIYVMKKDAILLPTCSSIFHIYQRNIIERDSNIHMWKYN